jgi:putative Holliday junction resolvase
MNGSKGPQSVKVEEFSLKLAEYTNMPFCFWDERWSTQAVEKMMVHADLSRNKRDKNRDALAAAYILQGALDSLRFAQS